MRKNFFLGSAAVAVVALAAVNVNYALQDKDLSTMVLENVEALAQEQGGGSSSYWNCWSSQKAGSGYWRCGSPCTWIDAYAGQGPTSLCHAN